MEIRDLGDNLQKFTNACESIGVKRMTWIERTKPLINNCLTKIINAYPIGWELGVQENPNLEEIYLFFPIKTTGIIVIDGDNRIKLSKVGGALVFAQKYNGEISITIHYPTIDKIRIVEKSYTLNHYSPYDITTEIIIKKVNDFLKEMTEWENENY